MHVPSLRSLSLSVELTLPNMFEEDDDVVDEELELDPPLLGGIEGV